MSLPLDQILDRLEQIEADLGERQEPYAEAAEAFHRTEREMELRLAQTKLAIQADTQTEKKDRALVEIAAASDDLYRRHVDAEAIYEAHRAAVKVLETRSTIGMSLLKAHTRTEAPVSPTGRMYGRQAA